MNTYPSRKIHAKVPKKNNKYQKQQFAQNFNQKEIIA